MSERAKCEGREGPYCSLLSERLHEPNARKAGLSVLRVTSTRTGKSRNIGVCFRTKASDRGMMLNLCPWCGADIKPREDGEFVVRTEQKINEA